MLNALFKFVFKIITKVADILLTPLVSGISALFPSLTSYFRNMTDFLVSALTYVTFLLDFLLIPRGAVRMLFVYFGIKYSIYLVKVSFNFVIKIYNLLKP